MADLMILLPVWESDVEATAVRRAVAFQERHGFIVTAARTDLSPYPNSPHATFIELRAASSLGEPVVGDSGRP